MWCALKEMTWKVRRVTPSCLQWNKICRARNLKHRLTLLTYIQKPPITWQLRSEAAGSCVKHERKARTIQTGALQPVALFLLSDSSYFNTCLHAKNNNKCTYCVLSVKTPTSGLNLYSECTCRLTSIVPRSIHLGAWVTFCTQHTQLIKELIWFRA